MLWHGVASHERRVNDARMSWIVARKFWTCAVDVAIVPALVMGFQAVELRVGWMFSLSPVWGFSLRLVPGLWGFCWSYGLVAFGVCARLEGG